MLTAIRQSIRVLRRSPATTSLALIALALGIGANTALFSVVRAVLLKPLPYSEPNRLVAIWEQAPNAGKEPTSGPNFVDWRARNRVFESMAAFATWMPTIVGEGEPEQIPGIAVTRDYLHTLRLNPLIGREFSVEEDSPDGPKAVMLTYGLWERRFGRDPAVLGRAVRTDAGVYTIIGVLPPHFESPNINRDRRPAEWVRARVLGKLNPNERRADYMNVIARMKPGVSFGQARDDMARIGKELTKEYPNFNTGVEVRTTRLDEAIAGDAGRPLWLLLGAVGLVLLIACANVATLMVARAADRRREFAVRAALGGGRWRLASQALIESVVLSLVGGGLGLLAAAWLKTTLMRVGQSFLPNLRAVDIDPWVLSFCLAVSALTGVLFGFLPALESARTDLNEALKAGARGAGAHPRSRGLRNALIVAQVALTMVLLVGAGLLIRTFIKLRGTDLGFQPDRLITADVRTRRGKGVEPANPAVLPDLITSVRAMPGVAGAAAINAAPIGGSNNFLTFVVEGRPEPKPGDTPDALISICTPEYFRTMGIQLRRGRWFAEADQRTAPAVAVVNETFARKHFAGSDPIGHRVDYGRGFQTIVGVVADVRHTEVASEAYAQIYSAWAQQPWFVMSLVVRTVTDAPQLSEGIRTRLRSLDPEASLANIHTLNQAVSESLESKRFAMLLLAAFAGLAVLVSCVGVYAVVSYSVVQQLPEIGVRIAIGASPLDVFRMIAMQGSLPVIAGLSIGAVLSLAATRLMATMLYGVAPHDPLTIVAVVVLFAAVTAIALAMPAVRATRVDPITALRCD